MFEFLFDLFSTIDFHHHDVDHHHHVPHQTDFGSVQTENKLVGDFLKQLKYDPDQKSPVDMTELATSLRSFANIADDLAHEDGGGPILDQ